MVPEPSGQILLPNRLTILIYATLAREYQDLCYHPPYLVSYMFEKEEDPTTLQTINENLTVIPVGVIEPFLPFDFTATTTLFHQRTCPTWHSHKPILWVSDLLWTIANHKKKKLMRLNSQTNKTMIHRKRRFCNYRFYSDNPTICNLFTEFENEYF